MLTNYRMGTGAVADACRLTRVTAVATSPTTTGEPPDGAEVRTRRPRMRLPAYEPEPVGPPAASPAALPALLPMAVAHPGAGAGRGVAGGVTAGDTVAVGIAGPGPAVRAGRVARPDQDVHRRATALVRAMVEVLAGRRAPAHLAGVARPEVVRYLTASRASGPGTQAATAPGRVHVCRPGPDAAEVVAVCRFGRRFRALTIRMDRRPSERGPAWCATAVRLL